MTGPVTGNNQARRSKLRLALWRWHRRLGLLSAIFVLLLAITGILINHGHALQLDKAAPPAALLKLFYSLELPEPVSYRAGQRVFTQWGETVYRDGSVVADCRGVLRGAISHPPYDILACDRELLLLLAKGGQLVEKLGSAQGLLPELTGIGRCGDATCLRTTSQAFYFDPDTMVWRPAQEGEARHWATAIATPEALGRELAAGQAPEVTWERLLLDLHSGRIAGLAGVLVMDLMALVFIILAGSGFFIWLIGKGRRPARRGL